jgi:HD-GYP domain-containing protein (c-di-GMP phosphodiesterase class II)
MPIPPATLDRIQQALAALRSLSTEADPAAAARRFWQEAAGLLPFDRTLLLSRTDLNRPQYRITFSSDALHHGPQWSSPVFGGGLLAELLWEGRPRLIEGLEPPADDPAHDLLAGMHGLAAFPHFENDQPLDMAIHLWTGPAAVDPARLPDLALISGLFTQVFQDLVLNRKLKQTQDALTSHNKIMADLGDVVIEQARQLKRHAEDLEQRVRERTADLDEANADAIFMLALASEQKDQTTGDHIRRVELLTRRLARRMGFTDSASLAVGRAAILHDVGKLHIPDAILQKPARLTEEERALMQQHAAAGERILADRPAFAAARRIARSHHEDWAGTGYPDGLAGHAIPIEARIVHAVDVYDALVSSRPYKEAWSPEAALDHLTSQTGTMFDPDVIAAFRAMIRESARSNDSRAD